MPVFNETQALKILEDLVAIKSVNDKEAEVATYLHDLLTKYHINSKIKTIRNGRANLVAEIGSGKPVLGVSGHMDVVSAGDAEAWSSDPFSMTERAGKLFGRGITDMKAGLAALIIAMIELHSQGLPKRGTIRLMATMGEEIGEEGSSYLYEEGYMEDVSGLIIAEPSGYNIGHAEKGSMDIKFISEGKSSHSSMPENGYNAIDSLMTFLLDANQHFRNLDITHYSMGPLIFNTTLIAGGTQVNSIPDYASAEANVRTIPEFNNQQVIDVLESLMKKYNAQGAKLGMDIYMNESPVAMNSDNTLSALTSILMRYYTDQPITVSPISPVTDASNLLKNKPADFPFIIAGPGNDTPHQINEYVEKQMYFNFIELYQKIFLEFL